MLFLSYFICHHNPRGQPTLLPLFSNPFHVYSLILPTSDSKLLKGTLCRILSVQLSTSFCGSIHRKLLKKCLISSFRESAFIWNPSPIPRVTYTLVPSPPRTIRAATLGTVYRGFCWALSVGSQHLLLQVNSRSGKPLLNLCASTLCPPHFIPSIRPGRIFVGIKSPRHITI